jgi:hypothetical protein
VDPHVCRTRHPATFVVLLALTLSAACSGGVVPVAASASASGRPAAVATTRALVVASQSSPVGAWPFVAATVGPVAFGPDGTVYALVPGHGDDSGDIVILDRAGLVTARLGLYGAGGGTSWGGLLVTSDGTASLTSCGPRSGCWLSRHQTESAGSLGFSEVRVIGPGPAPATATCSGPVAGPDGTVYAACLQATASGSVGGRTVAVGPSGTMKRGWPVRVAGDRLAIARDGTVYVGSSERVDSSDGRTRHRLTITALAPDGAVRRGWPVILPAGDADWVLGRDGIVRAWWRTGIDAAGLGYGADTTVYTALGRDGRTLPGWPVTVPGAASDPAVSADGTVYYVAPPAGASGGRDVVYARDRTGRVRPGWPVNVVGYGGSLWGPTLPPYLSPDGSVYVVRADWISALTPRGAPVPGWPVPPPGYLGGCSTPSGSVERSPAFGSDGTMYIDVSDCETLSVSLAALDRAGHVPACWPQATGLVDVLPAPDGRLFVLREGAATAPTRQGLLPIACLQPLDPAAGIPFLGCDFALVPTRRVAGPR